MILQWVLDSPKWEEQLCLGWRLASLDSLDTLGWMKFSFGFPVCAWFEKNPLDSLCVFGRRNKPLGSMYVLIGYQWVDGGWRKLISGFHVYYLTAEWLVGEVKRSFVFPVSTRSWCFNPLSKPLSL